ncbi:hypothetical protein ACH437_28165 [Streptomyces xinghaiensis]|uniref:hypothetical protein n=1 Tax=Streptomyces xinghaiensis TaxID=1038928 RepID=UPI00379DBCC2
MFRNALTVTAIIVTSTALSTGLAFAGTDAFSTTGQASARFISYGDKFEVCDLASDGATAYVQYEYVRINGTLQKGEHRNPGNAGSCHTFDHNFGEGRVVKFRACEDHTAWPDHCDSWKKGIA